MCLMDNNINDDKHKKLAVSQLYSASIQYWLSSKLCKNQFHFWQIYPNLHAFSLELILKTAIVAFTPNISGIINSQKIFFTEKHHIMLLIKKWNNLNKQPLIVKSNNTNGRRFILKDKNILLSDDSWSSLEIIDKYEYSGKYEKYIMRYDFVTEEVTDFIYFNLRKIIKNYLNHKTDMIDNSLEGNLGLFKDETFIKKLVNNNLLNIN